MNWCKIGFHDWEVVNDRKLLKEAIKVFMQSIGFVLTDRNRWAVWVREKDGVAISDWSMGGVESEIPCSPKSKACLRCGKTHKNYDEAKVIRKVHDLVLGKVAEKAREKKARELLGRSE